MIISKIFSLFNGTSKMLALAGDDVLNIGFNYAVASFEDFLKDNDEWFDLIFNSKF